MTTTTTTRTACDGCDQEIGFLDAHFDVRPRGLQFFVSGADLCVTCWSSAIEHLRGLVAARGPKPTETTGDTK